jgi:hypothetical protein
MGQDFSLILRGSIVLVSRIGHKMKKCNEIRILLETPQCSGSSPKPSTSAKLTILASN